MALRERLGRGASPTAAVIDSQSLKSAEKGGGKDDQVGYDAGKKVKGRKIHALVDTKQRFPWLVPVWADGGCNARQVEEAAAVIPRFRVEIVKRTDDMKGFVVLPRRRVVERTFSWFGRNRRPAKYFENLADTLAAFVTIASIQLAVRRLARM